MKKEKENIKDTPFLEEGPARPWQPPPSPSFDKVDWFVMVWERFGFLTVSALVLAAAGMLYLKADELLPEPETWTPPTEEEGAASASPGLTSPMSSLSVVTTPDDATVLINGDSVGVTPLPRFPLAAGTHRVSVRKTSFAPRDTVITTQGRLAILVFTLDALESQQDLQSPGAGVATTGDEAETTEVEGAATDAAQTDTDVTAEAPDPPGPARDTSTAETDDTLTEESPPADEKIEELPSEKEADLPMPEEPEIQVGGIQFTSEPTGAEVWLDDTLVGSTPVEVGEVPADTHAVMFRLEGYEDYPFTLVVEPEPTSQVHRLLTPILGTLKILAKPWGHIYIDGQLHKSESSIWYTAQLPPGEYRVRVIHPSLGKWEQAVLVPAADTKEIVVDFNM